MRIQWVGFENVNGEWSVTCKHVHVRFIHCRHHQLLDLRAPARRKQHEHVDVGKSAHTLNGGASGVTGSSYKTCKILMSIWGACGKKVLEPMTTLTCRRRRDRKCEYRRPTTVRAKSLNAKLGPWKSSRMLSPSRRLLIVMTSA